MTAEEIQDESEEMFRVLSNASPVAVIVYRNNKHLYVNSAAISIFGYTREELLAMDFINLVHPGYRDIIKERALARMGGEGKQSRYEAKVITKAGEEKWLDVSSNLIRYEGSPAGIVICTDITERKKMEEELRSSEEQLRSIFESTQDAIITIDDDMRCTNANLGAGAITGISHEQLVGQMLPDFLDPDFDLFAAWPAFIQTGRFKGEVGIRHKDGTFRTIEATGIANILPGQHLFVGHDITERKRAEEAINAERKQLLSIFGSINEIIYIADMDTYEILYANNATQKFFGQNLVGKLCYKALQGKDKPCDFCTNPIIRKLHCQPYLWEFHNSLVGKDFQIVDRVIQWPDGRDVRFEIAIDVTERKEIEKELRRSKDELEQRVQERTIWLQRANEALHYEMMKHKETEAELIKAKEAADAAVEAKASFLANMSHEIRTPMNAVIGLTGLLLDMDLKPEQKECVETIRSSSDALLAIITDILDFSKIDSGKMELEHQPFDLRSCIEESIDLVAQKAKEKGLCLAYRMDDSVPSAIISDPTRLRQILINLLSNAVKFTEMGNVDVCVASQAMDDGKCRLHFAINDTGIGIPQDRMDKIFRSFSQADMSTTRKYGGTGLGLAISKRLVEIMDGKIWAESVEGKGSTFHFTLPVDEYLDRLPKPKEAPAQRKSKVHANMRILLAEDNAVNQRVLLQMLKNLGYRADVAADGIEVLKAMELQSYDLVLMDVQMPEMDGFETTREIRRRWPNGPMIVALTAYALEGDREKCLDAGMDDYLSKPVKMDCLVEVLSKITQSPKE
ncbi:MAG: PAS domain S-box protein [Methanotrichaceae archaeon]